MWAVKALDLHFAYWIAYKTDIIDELKMAMMQISLDAKEEIERKFSLSLCHFFC